MDGLRNMRKNLLKTKKTFLKFHIPYIVVWSIFTKMQISHLNICNKIVFSKLPIPPTNLQILKAY
jgi:hypothetical protein